MNKNCMSFWWSNLIFINNFVPLDGADMCMGWVWYLANDFQLFIVSPFLILAYCFNRKLGYLLLLILVITSMTLNGIETAAGNVSPAGQSDSFDAFTWMYIKPWIRMGPYFLGAIIGLSYFELSMREDYIDLGYTTFNKIYEILRNSRAVSLVLALTGIAITAIFVFPLGFFYDSCDTFNPGAPKNCWGTFPSTLFNTLNRVSFTLGVTFILMPMFVHRLRVFRGLLACELFTALAKLCYIVYLIHPIVMFWNLFDMKQAVYVSNLTMWFFGIGSVVVTFLLAMPFTLLCEAPFVNAEKFLLMKSKSEEEQHKESFSYIGESNLIQNETAAGDDEEPSLNMKRFDD